MLQVATYKLDELNMKQRITLDHHTVITFNRVSRGELTGYVHISSTIDACIKIQTVLT